MPTMSRVSLDSATPTRKHEPTTPRGPREVNETETSVNISPGIIALYWLAASFAATVLWSTTARAFKRAGHRAASRCYCGSC